MIRLAPEHGQAAGKDKCLWSWQPRAGGKVETRTLACAERLTIPRVPYSTDRARSGPIPDVEPPDLTAKLEGRQKPRGWGLFLIKHMVDELDVSSADGLQTVTLTVANTGDRPIQVGSHYHFFETNPALRFDRKKARGMRLDIAAGTAVRFEPGQTREVTLVALAGKRAIYGFRQEIMGKL